MDSVEMPLVEEWQRNDQNKQPPMTYLVFRFRLIKKKASTFSQKVRTSEETGCTSESEVRVYFSDGILRHDAVLGVHLQLARLLVVAAARYERITQRGAHVEGTALGEHCHFSHSSLQRRGRFLLLLSVGWVLKLRVGNSSSFSPKDWTLVRLVAGVWVEQWMLLVGIGIGIGVGSIAVSDFLFEATPVVPDDDKSVNLVHQINVGQSSPCTLQPPFLRSAPFYLRPLTAIMMTPPTTSHRQTFTEG